MAKPKSGAKKATPAAKKDKAGELELLKNASKQVAKAATKVVKAVTEKVREGGEGGKAPAKAPPRRPRGHGQVRRQGQAAAKSAEPETEPKAKKAKAAAAPKGKAAAAKPGEGCRKGEKAGRPRPAKAAKSAKGKGKGTPARARRRRLRRLRPRRSRARAPPSFPRVGEPLTKREMEQLLTAGEGRGVVGEGSLKGRLVVKDGCRTCMVVGRDKRELIFLLQGPDQEVSRRTWTTRSPSAGSSGRRTNYGGTVDVRKYSAKKPEAEAPPPRRRRGGEAALPVPGRGRAGDRNAGMGAGMQGLRLAARQPGDDRRGLLPRRLQRRHPAAGLLPPRGQGRQGAAQVRGPAAARHRRGGEVLRLGRQASRWRTSSRGPPSAARISRERHGDRPRGGRGGPRRWRSGSTTASPCGCRSSRATPGPSSPPPPSAWACARRTSSPASERPGTREFFFTPRNPGPRGGVLPRQGLHSGQVERSFKLTVTVKP